VGGSLHIHWSQRRAVLHTAHPWLSANFSLGSGLLRDDARAILKHMVGSKNIPSTRRFYKCSCTPLSHVQCVNLSSSRISIGQEYPPSHITFFLWNPVALAASLRKSNNMTNNMSDNMAMASPSSPGSAALYQTTKELISQHTFEV
jgi:hypothetical protein